MEKINGRMTWGASDKGEAPSRKSDSEKKGPARLLVCIPPRIFHMLFVKGGGWLKRREGRRIAQWSAQYLRVGTTATCLVSVEMKQNGVGKNKVGNGSDDVQSSGTRRAALIVWVCVSECPVKCRPERAGSQVIGWGAVDCCTVAA